MLHLVGLLSVTLSMIIQYHIHFTSDLGYWPKSVLMHRRNALEKYIKFAVFYENIAVIFQVVWPYDHRHDHINTGFQYDSKSLKSTILFFPFGRERWQLML